MATEVGAAYVKLGLDSSQLKTGLAAALGSLQSWHGRALKYATIAIGVVGAAAAVRGLKSVISTAAEYEQAMAMVKSVTGATDEQFAALDATAKELGRTSRWTMTEIANAMENLGRAGFSTEEIIAAVGGISDLAASQMMDFATASDIATAVLRGMGLAADEAGRVADVLAKTASTSASRVEDLGEAFKYWVGTARTYNISLEESAAMMGILANAGFRGSVATAALRTAFNRLADPTKEAAELMDELGISFFDAQGNFIGLANMVDMLNEAFKGMTQEQKAAAISTLFTSRSFSQIDTLLEAGGDALRAYTEELENAGGTAQQMAETQLDTLQGQLIVLKGSWDLLKTTIGEKLLPILKDFVQNTLIPLVNNLASSAEGTDVLSGAFQRFFDGLKALINWIVEHGDTVVAVIENIAKAFAALIALKVATWIGDVVTGLISLASEATAAATAIGTAGGAGLVGALSTLGGLLAAGGIAAGAFMLGRKLRERAGDIRDFGDEIVELNRIAEEAANAATAQAGLPPAPSMQDIYTGATRQFSKAEERFASEALTAPKTLVRNLKWAKDGLLDFQGTLDDVIADTIDIAAEWNMSWDEYRQKLEEIKSQLQSIPEEERTKIGVDEATYNQAIQMIQSIQAYIDSLPKSVTIGVSMSGPTLAKLRQRIMILPEGAPGSEGVEAKQAGGPVPGAGRGDIIPALLEPGEFVVPRWMMGIPWLRALIYSIWRGRKMQRGGPLIEGELGGLRAVAPSISPRGAPSIAAPAAAAAGALGEVADQALLASQDIEFAGGQCGALGQCAQQAAEEAKTLAQIIGDIKIGDPLAAAEELLKYQKDAAKLNIEEINAVRSKYESLVSSLENAIEWLEKTTGEAGDLPEILAKIKEMFGDIPSELETALNEIGTGDILEAPLETAERLRELAELGIGPVADRAEELARTLEDEIRQKRLLGLETAGAERALAEFRAGLQGTTPELQALRDAIQSTAKTHVEILADSLRSLASLIKSHLSRAIHDFLRKLFGLGAEDVGSSMNVPTGYKVVRAAWKAARPGEPGALREGGMGDFWDALLGLLADALAEWSITDIVVPLLDWFITDIVKPIADWFITDIIAPVADWVWEHVLKGPAQWIWEKVLLPVGKFLLQGFGAILQAIGNLIAPIGAAILNGLRAVWATLAMALGPIGATVAMVVGALTLLSIAFGGFKNLIEAIGKAIKGVLNAVIGVVNAFISVANFFIPDWIGVIPKIPYLQGGGAVLGEGLAYLHAGELVLPPARVEPFPTAGIPSGGTTIHLYNVLDSRVIGEAVVRVQRDREARLTGSTVGTRAWRVA